MLILILIILLAMILFALYYGYKLAFYYKDPLNSLYEYVDDDQTRACKKVLDDAIAEFEKEPFEKISILSDDGLQLAGRYYHVADDGSLEIQCHGYKGNATRDFCGNWKIAKEAGRNILLIDERCHGNSQGHTITFGILERTDVLN